MLLKVAMHAHTRRSDGVLSPNEMLRIHAEQGFDAVAITDHDLELTEDDISQFNVPEGLLILRGNEVSFRELYWQHVNHIYGDTEVLKVLNHPARYGMTVRQIEEAVDKFGFDAFEITNQGTYCPQYERANGSLPRVSSDDSHTEAMIGRSYMVVDAIDRTTDAIIQAIKAHKVEIIHSQKPAAR